MVAMQFEITDPAAIIFARSYGAIADGYPFDAALAEGGGRSVTMATRLNGPPRAAPACPRRGIFDFPPHRRPTILLAPAGPRSPCPEGPRRPLTSNGPRFVTTANSCTGMLQVRRGLTGWRSAPMGGWWPPPATTGRREVGGWSTVGIRARSPISVLGGGVQS